MGGRDAKLWLKKKALRKNDLFSDLDDGKLDFIIGYANTKLLSEGEFLYHKGEEANGTFCVIIFGKMKVVGPHGQFLAELKAGEVLGEIGIIGIYNKRTADVLAAEATLILEWTFSDINEKAPYLLPKLKQAALKRLNFSRGA
ncbi:MAG: cyclic nucleotide-binding domain-containing protein [bacterium]|nr:cyclic nucleotide-binding domain-containing protein [bacterium]